MGSSAATELRGWVSRQLLAEDARWVSDVVLSSASAGACKAYPALLLGQHFVRIAYEGAIAIRSTNPNVGWPQLALLLTDEYQAITARARHMSKLLDDNKKSDDEVLDALRVVQEHNTASLTGKAPRLLRWLEADLGLYMMHGSVVGATIPIAYRLALDPNSQASMGGEDLHAVSREWGATMAVLMAAALETPLETGTLQLKKCGVTYRNRMAGDLLGDCYEGSLALEVKFLLLMIEGDLNTNRHFLPLTEAGHEMATFRARVVTLYHSLSTLKRVLDRSAGPWTREHHDIATLLADDPVRRILGTGGRQVRNRCVHYEIGDPKVVPDPSRPMFGIVEAVNPAVTWESFNEDVLQVCEWLADGLASWREGKGKRLHAWR